MQFPYSFDPNRLGLHTSLFRSECKFGTSLATMCGIWALLGASYDHGKHEPEFMRIVGRGPDFTVAAEVAENVVLGFHRLAIVEVGCLRVGDE